MEQLIIHYEFVNSITGNVIGYLSLPDTIDKTERIHRLNRKKAEVAMANNLDIFVIYWQERSSSLE
jgi:hypothetical protein